MLRKTLLALLLLGSLALAGSALLVWHLDRVAQAPLPLPPDPLALRIPKGSSARSIAEAFRDQGLVSHPWELLAIARLLELDGKLQAGVYRVAPPMTLHSLLLMLSRGQVATSDVGFPEGWTLRQIRASVESDPALEHPAKSLSDDALARALGAEGSLEGWLAPDTYRADFKSSDLELYARAYRAQKSRLEKAWAERAPGLPYQTPQEALVMASIIEKETAEPSERPLIAAVFVNRLRLGMRLQTDPTVIYGLGPAFDGNLRKADLLADTPYNTYTRAGLPPTPIAAPGLASIRAALRPAESPHLYFVASGGGRHQFSETLEQHNAAVREHQLGLPPAGPAAP